MVGDLSAPDLPPLPFFLLGQVFFLVLSLLAGHSVRRLGSRACAATYSLYNPRLSSLRPPGLCFVKVQTSVG